MDIQSVKQRFGIIGSSPALNNAISIAMRVAPTNLSVLISGESGVGKEIFSQIIHSLSPRKHNPFIAVNCGAIPEGTIDSELFGHEKGAFTGAHEARKGYFEFVKEGTIFLDEVGELPLGTQARLLRVLEQGEFIRVGSSKVQKTDVRVIAATNVDLLESIEKNKFREDLYYRLNTVPIHVPALRERREDIYLLFRKFALNFAEKHNTSPIQLDDQAQQLLADYHWPGNVRQLKNVAEQLSVLAKEKIVSADELAQYIPDIKANKLPALITQRADKEDHNYSERELLYKLFFDIKKDINELKKVVYEIAESTNGVDRYEPEESYNKAPFSEVKKLEGKEPIILKESAAYDNEENIVDESLSIADKEKELIIKALEKHRGKRKDAALDLGISERTLYRKIKEYDIIE